MEEGEIDGHCSCSRGCRDSMGSEWNGPLELSQMEAGAYDFKYTPMAIFCPLESSDLACPWGWAGLTLNEEDS